MSAIIDYQTNLWFVSLLNQWCIYSESLVCLSSFTSQILYLVLVNDVGTLMLLLDQLMCRCNKESNDHGWYCFMVRGMTILDTRMNIVDRWFGTGGFNTHIGEFTHTEEDFWFLVLNRFKRLVLIYYLIGYEERFLSLIWWWSGVSQVCVLSYLKRRYNV